MVTIHQDYSTFKNRYFQISCLLLFFLGIPYFLDPNRLPVPVKVEKSFVFHRSVEGSGAHKPHLLKLEGWVDKPVTYTGDKVLVSVRLDNNSGR